MIHFHSALPPSREVPDWVHLLPAGTFKGVDGRGPYEVADAATVITHSMQAHGGKLPIDENHSTDRAAVSGGSAPAVGWIVELQNRADGIWGRVDWTRAGEALLGDHAYRGISPAFLAPGGKVSRIERASLTNLPNLPLSNLHNQEPRMDLAEVRRRLRLPETATQAEVEAALDNAGAAVSLHSQIAPLVGLAADVGADALITGLRARLAGTETHAQTRITALESEISSLKTGALRTAAENFVEATGRTHFVDEGARDTLIELHMQSPEKATALVGSLREIPKGVHTHSRKTAASAEDAEIASAAAAWGQNPDDVRKHMKGAA